MFHKVNPRETTVAISINNRCISPSPKYPSKPPAIQIFIHIKFQNLKKQKTKSVDEEANLNMAIGSSVCSLRQKNSIHFLTKKN
jgi:hypothetical protein